MGGFVLAAAALALFAPLSLLLWAWTRGVPKEGRGGGTLVFRYHAAFRYFALVTGLGCPLGITILAVFNPPRDDGEAYAIIGCYSLFAALTLPLMWETSLYALVVTRGGLDCHSPWRGRRFVRWEDVRSVCYAEANSWFVVRARGGYRFRVPRMTGGSGRFLECLEEHLAPAALEDARGGYSRVGRAFPAARRLPPVDLRHWREPPLPLADDEGPRRRDERTTKREDDY